MTSHRHRRSRAELEKDAAFAGLSLEEWRQDPDDRRLFRSCYAADGVCEFGSPCDVDPRTVPDETVDEFVEACKNWRADNDGLSPSAFNRLRSRWATAGPGQSATGPGEGRHMREVTADDLVSWVEEHTAAGPVELDATVYWADLHGVPAPGGLVPLVVALDGEWGAAARDSHRHFHALTRVRRQLKGNGKVRTDGGAPARRRLDGGANGGETT